MNYRLLASLFLLTAFLPLHAQDEKAADPAQVFSKMLTNATLKGTWAPIDKKLLGGEQEDGYHIVKAVPKEGDIWNIHYKFKMQGQEIVFPIPVTIKFAGDAAVMILDDSPVGIGQTWSARILFHDDVYTGTWWNKGKTKGGIVSGTISRATAEKK